ncbi:LysR family transcriptional regulator [Blastococcus sp. SYSU D00669]
MDVRQLALLRELGERGSVAAVARALFVTPSAVSQQLTALQRSVRAPLTEKRGRRLVLTPAGEALAAAAVEVSAALDRARRAVDAYLDEPSAAVSVAAFHSAALAWFAPLLERVAGGPVVSCTDQDVAQSAFPALVADHDLVLAHRHDASPPWPAGRLAVVPLVREPLHVALPAGSPLAARESLTAADVAGEPWVSVHEGFPLEAPLQAVAAAAHRPLDVRHRINEFGVAASVVAAGAAVALLPAYTTRPDPAVVLRPLADVAPARYVDVLARPENLARASVRTVLDALREVVAERIRR